MADDESAPAPELQAPVKNALRESATVESAQAAVAPKAYTVVARRYRPQRFEEVVGQDHVLQALGNAIRLNRIAQAYLFCGTRGVGKTSIARIFAKCLNCVRGPTTDPCQTCDICQSIALGQDVDVIEIDGASNNGVEQVRELRQNAALRPSRARFKVYYIDEVHMLSTGAFNALLKTLEEPPAHVKFLFATTEANKIPITVLSRCQRYDLAGIIPDVIARTLGSICAQEQVEAEPEALQIVARRASGSLRDAQSLLDRLLASGSSSTSPATPWSWPSEPTRCWRRFRPGSGPGSSKSSIAGPSTRYLRRHRFSRNAAPGFVAVCMAGCSSSSRSCAWHGSKISPRWRGSSTGSMRSNPAARPSASPKGASKSESRP